MRDKAYTLFWTAVLVLFIAAIFIALGYVLFAAVLSASADCAIGWPECPVDTLTPVWVLLPAVMR